MARKSRPPRPTKQAGLTEAEAPPPSEVLAPPHPRIGYIGGSIFFTEEQRKIVAEMALWGVPYRSICQKIPNPDSGKPIDMGTLAKYFGDELDIGRAHADTQVARMAYLQAVGTPAEYDENGKLLRAEVPPVPMMTKWLTQSRLGFKDTVVVENTAGSITLEAASKFVANLNYDEMLQLRDMQKRIREDGSDVS